MLPRRHLDRIDTEKLDGNTSQYVQGRKISSSIPGDVKSIYSKKIPEKQYQLLVH